MNRCYVCEKGTLNKKKVNYSLYGELIGEFDAEVCTKCGETFFSEETSRKITEIAKKKGLWGLEAKTKIGQAGSTLDVRLPQKIIAYMKLKKGKEVTIIPESKHKLVLRI